MGFFADNSPELTVFLGMDVKDCMESVCMV